MTSSDAELAELAARNAALRERVDGLFDRFTRETERLRQARESMAALSAEVLSPDGLVQVKINSAGELAGLWISATAFERTRPEALARTISDLVRRGTAQVRQRKAELMGPFAESMPDLSDVIEGAPSLAALQPPAPEVPVPEPPTISAPTPPVVRRPSRPVADDEMSGSWMREDEF